MKRKQQCEITKSKKDKTHNPDKVLFPGFQRGFCDFCGSWSHLKDKTFNLNNLENISAVVFLEY